MKLRAKREEKKEKQVVERGVEERNWHVLSLMVVTSATFHFDRSALNVFFWLNKKYMLVTLLVSQSCIRPYVVSTVSLLVPPAIQSSTTFRRPLLRLKLIKGTQSGTGITASTVAVDKRNIKVRQSLMPAVGLLFVHFIFWIWFFFSYTRSGAATRFWFTEQAICIR